MIFTFYHQQSNKNNLNNTFHDNNDQYYLNNSKFAAGDVYEALKSWSDKPTADVD